MSVHHKNPRQKQAFPGLGHQVHHMAEKAVLFLCSLSPHPVHLHLCLHFYLCSEKLVGELQELFEIILDENH